ncbi:hypothetical protein GCM10011613_06610 [Cellvibrio zantedeschiae]|uniref:DUF4239 domain-containing protein n=1 Tax=Cellvibrio zantedeschiae TaxID=1237077 RepID=A0ABQ3AVR0_9GAMM|nr:DUF4239 domain-containing protein [Cellvibrio zantedeschiae]GGY65430.1 hypothetical protein GCM10011613_06610 [Cellvibrio zantedeschiae]
MNLYWLYDLPNWLFCALVVVAFVTFSMLGLWLSRRLVLRFIGKHPNNDIVSFYLAAVGVFYGITLGLIAVSTYTSYSEAGDIASQEAAAISALYRDINSYPEPERSKLRQQVKEYVRIVIEDVWPRQQQGEAPMFGTHQLNQINTTLLEFTPNTEREKIIHTEALNQFNNALTQNSLRLQSVQSGLPATMYMVIIIGALLNIMVSWLFIIENFRLQSLLNILMAGLLGLLVFLIAVMDYPYRGDYSIKPDGLEFVRDNIMKE